MRAGAHKRMKKKGWTVQELERVRWIDYNAMLSCVVGAQVGRSEELGPRTVGVSGRGARRIFVHMSPIHVGVGDLSPPAQPPTFDF